MPQVVLPNIRDTDDPNLQIQYMYDAFYKLRKELTFLLQNLDSDNVLEAQSVVADWVYAGKITTDQIEAGQAKISTALIEDLVVGDNVIMGPNAKIAWENVTDTEDILSKDNFQTVITKDYIASMNLIVGNEIKMGPNATISWSQVTNKPTIPVLPSYIQSTYIDATTIMSPTIVAGQFIGGMFRINPTGDPSIESGLTIGGWYENGWQGTAFKIQFDPYGNYGFPGTVISGGAEVVFQIGVDFYSAAHFHHYVYFYGDVSFAGATVTGLNYAPVNHTHPQYLAAGVDDYVHAGSGQKITLQVYNDHLEFRLGNGQYIKLANYSDLP